MKHVICLLTLTMSLAINTAMAQGYGIGDQVEDFTLTNVDETQVSLSDYADDQGVIIIFTCNHCPYAVAYEDRIIDLHERMAPKGYPVLAINPNDPEVQPQDGYEEMKERADEKGFKFAYLFDEGQHVYPKFGATRTPHVFLLDKDHRVQYIGAIDDNYKDVSAVKEYYLEDAIAALERGEQPVVKETKAIGCSIKKK